MMSVMAACQVGASRAWRTVRQVTVRQGGAAAAAGVAGLALGVLLLTVPMLAMPGFAVPAGAAEEPADCARHTRIVGGELHWDMGGAVSVSAEPPALPIGEGERTTAVSLPLREPLPAASHTSVGFAGAVMLSHQDGERVLLSNLRLVLREGSAEADMQADVSTAAATPIGSGTVAPSSAVETESAASLSEPALAEAPTAADTAPADTAPADTAPPSLSQLEETGAPIAGDTGAAVAVKPAASDPSPVLVPRGHISVASVLLAEAPRYHGESLNLASSSVTVTADAAAAAPGAFVPGASLGVFSGQLTLSEDCAASQLAEAGLVPAAATDIPAAGVPETRQASEAGDSRGSATVPAPTVAVTEPSAVSSAQPAVAVERERTMLAATGLGPAAKIAAGMMGVLIALVIVLLQSYLAHRPS